MAILLEQAKQLAQGTILHHTTLTNADGTPQRFKVTSVKTWKLSPWRVEVRVKRGMREHYRLTTNDLAEFEVAPTK